MHRKVDRSQTFIVVTVNIWIRTDDAYIEVEQNKSA